MFRNIYLLLALVFVMNEKVMAQSEVIVSLQEALVIALENDPSLRVDELARLKNRQLSKGFLNKPPTQITLSGDEFNFDENQGIQSLNIQQNFNHPRIAKAYNDYYSSKTDLSEQLLALSEKEIARHVKSAYYRVVFAKQYVKLTDDLQQVYDEFYQMANTSFQAGETNKLPVVSATTLQKKAQLLVNHANHEVEESKEILSIWLGTDKQYDAITMDLFLKPEEMATINQANPHLSIYETQKSIAMKNIDVQQALLLPQFITGLSLQSINGDLLFFGYQAGVNIPLFRKSYNNKIEAAKVEIEIQEERKNQKQKSLQLEVARITNHMEHLSSKIAYFDTELLPAAREEMNMLKVAYQAGETSYVEYMMALENHQQFQLERLELLEAYFMDLSQLNYWTAIN